MGELGTNTYIIWDKLTKETLIIDPADDGVGISEIIELKQLNPQVIFLTHGHSDHTGGANELKLIYQIPLLANSYDQFLLKKIKVDIDLKEKEELLTIGGKWEIIPTPGHTPGSVALYSLEENLLITGDTLTEEPSELNRYYCDRKKYQESVKKLLTKSQETLVLPGHGEERLLKYFGEDCR